MVLLLLTDKDLLLSVVEVLEFHLLCVLLLVFVLYVAVVESKRVCRVYLLWLVLVRLYYCYCTKRDEFLFTSDVL